MLYSRRVASCHRLCVRPSTRQARRSLRNEAGGRALSSQADDRASSVDGSSARAYFYDIDGHGFIHLSETKHRNLTNTLTRDRAFADFFVRRLRPLTPEQHADMPEPPVGERSEFTLLSLCAGEHNYARCAITPIVYRELVDGKLIWAGSLEVPFQPDQIRLSPEGYLFHPSPLLPPRRGTTEPRRVFGDYSLLSSRLVIAHLERKIETAEGASIEWNGQRHAIRDLEPGQTVEGRWVKGDV